MKPLRFTFLPFLLMLFSVGAYAQQEFTISGVIMESGAKIRIALAEITNTRNHYSVGSNDMGIFQIKSAIGDTLMIAKRGFNDKFIVVTATKDLVINLNRGNTLNEVVITGQRKSEVMNEIKKDFKNKGSFYAGKPPFLSFLLTPLTALYETFGRTPRNARRFNKYYNTEMQQTHIDQFFNKTIIHQNTGLDGKELDDFMINYRPDYEKTKNWNVYDGTKYILDSFKKYKDSAKPKLSRKIFNQVRSKLIA